MAGAPPFCCQTCQANVQWTFILVRCDQFVPASWDVRFLLDEKWKEAAERLD